MPNHVTNRLTAPAEVLALIVGTEDGKEHADFNLLIPMPKILEADSSGSRAHTAAEIALGLVNFKAMFQPQPSGPEMAEAFKKGLYGALAGVLHLQSARRQLLEGPMPKDLSDQEFEEFMTHLRAWKETGCLSWYEWRIEHWGTKWNAYEFERVDEDTITFETAWSAPRQVIDRLAYRSGGSFLHEWADEDTGNNVGWVRYVDGKRAEEAELSGTKEGYELAFELCGSGDNYEWDEEAKQYKYKEESDE